MTKSMSAKWLANVLSKPDSDSWNSKRKSNRSSSDCSSNENSNRTSQQLKALLKKRRLKSMILTE